jgi:hypothetical protein
MAKRTNRVAWGLAGVLSVALLTGAWFGLWWSGGPITVSYVSLNAVPFEQWRVSYSVACLGQALDLGPVEVIVWNH